jgi:uncharacterized repeat protein (TIGR01451 family)
MPAAQVSGPRRRRAPRVLAVLGLALAFAAFGSSGSASADASDPTTTTVLTVSPALAGVGDAVTMTATVTGVGGNPPGSVVFANGSNQIGTVTLTPVPGSSTTSQAVLVASSLAAGTYSLTATFNGDFFNFSSSTSSPVLLTVSGATIFNTTTTLSANPPTVATGQLETLTAQVSRVGDPGIPTGLVTFTDNGLFIGQAPLDAAGTATLTRSDFIAGPNAIVADYSGDNVDRASGSSLSLQVTGGSQAVQTTTTVTATPNPIVAGNTMSITAHVVQTGTQTTPPGGPLVTFRTAGAGGAFLAQAPLDAYGNATVSVAGWIPGQYVIEADYVGDINDLASSGTVTVSVAPQGADLSLTASATPASVHTADRITYSLLVVNGGLQAAQNVRLTDQLPAGTSFVSVAPGSPACAVTSGVLGCSLGAMANSAQQTVTLVVAVGQGLAGTTIADTAQVTSDTVDPNPANNTSTATTPVRAAADLQLTQTGPASALAGNPLGYTLTVTNAGPDAAATVTLSDTLPADLTAPSFTTTAGSCSIASGRLSCPLGTLAGGGTVTVTVAGTLSMSTAVTSISNTASVSSSTDDLNPANNTASVVTAVTPLAGCSAVGSVLADGFFTHVVGRRLEIVYVLATGDCDLDRRTGKVFLQHANLLVLVDGQVLVNAVQNARRNDITRVTISGPHDAVIVGTWAGTPFTVTLHDGTPNKDDSLRVQYGSFDTSTLTAKHGEVYISNH